MQNKHIVFYPAGNSGELVIPWEMRGICYTHETLCEQTDAPVVMTLDEYYWFKHPDTTDQFLEEFANKPNALLLVLNYQEPFELGLCEWIEYAVNVNPECADRIHVLCADNIYADTYREFFKKAKLDITGIHTFNNLASSKYLPPTGPINDVSVRFSIYSGSFKSWRGYIFYRLYQADLLDKMQCTFATSHGYNEITAVDIDQMATEITDHYPVTNTEKLNEFLSRCPYVIDDTDKFHGFPATLLQGIQCVIETLPDNLSGPTKIDKSHLPEEFSTAHLLKAFITEKTYRVIRHKLPFIILGPPANYDKLHAMGFKTFVRWFDEAGLRSPDFTERIDTLVAIVRKVRAMPESEYNLMMADMQEILQHNYDVLEQLTAHNTHEICALFDQFSEFTTIKK